MKMPFFLWIYTKVFVFFFIFAINKRIDYGDC